MRRPDTWRLMKSGLGMVCLASKLQSHAPTRMTRCSDGQIKEEQRQACRSYRSDGDCCDVFRQQGQCEIDGHFYPTSRRAKMKRVERMQSTGTTNTAKRLADSAVNSRVCCHLAHLSQLVLLPRPRTDQLARHLPTAATASLSWSFP